MYCSHNTILKMQSALNCCHSTKWVLPGTPGSFFLFFSVFQLCNKLYAGYTRNSYVQICLKLQWNIVYKL